MPRKARITSGAIVDERDQGLVRALTRLALANALQKHPARREDVLIALDDLLRNSEKV